MILLLLPMCSKTVFMYVSILLSDVTSALSLCWRNDEFQFNAAYKKRYVSRNAAATIRKRYRSVNAVRARVPMRYRKSRRNVKVTLRMCMIYLVQSNSTI